MRRSRLLALAILAATSAWLLSAAAMAGDMRAVLRGPVAPRPPQHAAVSPALPVNTPGPYRYPEYQAGSYPWYGYGFGVPTYQWGYFGAAYRPAVICHKGYYGDFTQFGYRRGY